MTEQRVRTLSRGLTLIELMIVVSILGILAAIVVPTFSQGSDDAKHATAAVNVKAVQTKIQEYYLNHDAWPDTIDPGWFAGGAIPDNPYIDGTPSLVVQNITGKTELDVKYPNSSGSMIFWYNRATGSFHTRVPWAGSDEATLELYNRVNHIEAVNY
ncbi:MAG: type II secretion system protein [Phycisphaeraceae bacterium]